MFSNRVSRGSLTQLCACVLFSSGPAATLATEPAPRVDRGTPRVEVASIVDGELAAAIERAAQGARRRLARPGCQRVLDEFRVASQASLREVAASVVASPEGALARAIFRDGRDAPACRRGAAAFTGPGSRVVFLCGERFTRIGGPEAELILIHEMLHTLGLGERPPTTRQIDQVVIRHCGG